MGWKVRIAVAGCASWVGLSGNLAEAKAESFRNGIVMSATKKALPKGAVVSNDTDLFSAKGTVGKNAGRNGFGDGGNGIKALPSKGRNGFGDGGNGIKALPSKGRNGFGDGGNGIKALPSKGGNGFGDGGNGIKALPK